MEETQPEVSGRCHVVLLVPETVQDLETAPVDVEVKRFIRDVQFVVQPLQASLASTYVFLCVFPPPEQGSVPTNGLDMTYTGPAPVPRLRARGVPVTGSCVTHHTSQPTPDPFHATAARVSGLHPHKGGGVGGYDDGETGVGAVVYAEEPREPPVPPGGATEAAAVVDVMEPDVPVQPHGTPREPQPVESPASAIVSPDAHVLAGDPSVHLARLAKDRLSPPAGERAGAAVPQPSQPRAVRRLPPEMVTNFLLPVRAQAMSEVSQQAVRHFVAWLREQLGLRQREKAMRRLTPADLDGVFWEWRRALPGESVGPVRASGADLSPTQRGGGIWPTRVALAVAVSCDVLWCSAWTRYWKDVHAGTSA